MHIIREASVMIITSSETNICVQGSGCTVNNCHK